MPVMMLSLAKDWLKKSQNFYLYKKSFNYVSSLSKNLTQRINEVEDQRLSILNVVNHPNHGVTNSEINKQDVSLKNYSRSSHEEIINSLPTPKSTHYSKFNSKEFEQSRIDMLLSSLVKTSLVDKHGILLTKTMPRLNSIHLQMFHNTFENYSKLSNSLLNRIKKIDRNKRHDSRRVPFKEQFSMGNIKESTFLLIESMKNPLMIRSSGFHTSAISPIFTSTGNGVSFDGKMGGMSRNQNSLAKNENSDIDEHSEALKNKFDFTNQEGEEGINSDKRFDEYENEFGNERYEKETDASSERNNLSRKSGGGTGRRHAKRQTQTSNKDDMATSENEVFNQEKMEKLFPDPRNTMNRVYSIVDAELKNGNHMPRATYTSVVAHKKLRQWQCTYQVSWPSELSFSAIARNKSVAANTAALKCLHYLSINGKVKNGLPMVYESEEIQDILHKPTKIEVKPDTISKIDQLLTWYNKDIAHLLSSAGSGLNKTGVSEIDVVDSREDIYEEGGEDGLMPPINDLISQSDSLTDPLRCIPLTQHSSVVLNKRDMEMYQNLREREFKGQKNLPIMDYREDIISQLEDERILVVKGEPGCGKSTQLPQFILDHFTTKGKGTDCNIIITQPRRISAISLAKRVADERNEQLGESIGYQVRLQSVLPRGPSGGVLFCSTGILLRRLQNNPNLLGCSHVILDEAHERDLNTDILIVLLNRALIRNPSLKLVIMSATINAGLFERYFNCNTISVPGFTYPVKMHFLEDMVKVGIRGITQQDMSLPNPSINSEQLANVIDWISRTKPHGAILCFLPGWSEIAKLKRILEEILPSRSHVILPVHSRLPHSDQALIFNRAPEGVRKVILATNIAETSITIDDVVYVVDSCAHKEVRLQHDTGRSSIDNQWVSQGNINQRKGRAGRVQPGESYHFITSEKYRSLDEFPTPEIMRAELHKAVLDCKTYTSEKAAEFFAQMPEPPRTSAVEHAVNELIEIGALKENEELTALGKRIALFPIDPRLSKVMVYSTIFQCVNPVVTLTSILSSEFEIFSDRLYDKSPIRRLKQQFEPASDHLALAWIFEQWNSHNMKNNRHAQQFCREAQLQFGKMMILKDLRNLYAQHLSQCRMLDAYARWDDLNSNVNRCANHDELVRGVLLAGLGRILQKKDGELKNGRFKKVKNVMLMQDGHRATLTPDSVNYNREKWPSSYLTYQRSVHSTERRTTLIRESSLVTPLTVLLFCEGEIETRNYRKNNVETKDVLLTFRGKKNVKLICDPETAKILLDLRHSMQNVVRYIIENQGLNNTDRYLVAIQSFKDHMVNLVSKMLGEASRQNHKSQELSSDEDEEDWSL